MLLYHTMLYFSTFYDKKMIKNNFQVPKKEKYEYLISKI